MGMTTKANEPRRTIATKGNIITPERAALMDRARERLMRGRTFTDSSADLTREERMDQL